MHAMEREGWGSVFPRRLNLGADVGQVGAFLLENVVGEGPEHGPVAAREEDAAVGALKVLFTNTS